MPRRTVALALALVVAVAALVWLRGVERDPRVVGMVTDPCIRNGKSVSARAGDDWAGVCKYAASNAALLESGTRPDLVMIGDSLTEAWPVPDARTVTRGIGGQTSAQILVRIGPDAIALRPRMVHILAGTNDIAGNTGPTSPEHTVQRIAAMAAYARAEGIEPILATLPPARDFYWQADVDPAPWLPRVNRLIRELAEREGYVLADYHAALGGRDGAFEQELYSDGVHPNAQGYARMAPVLAKARAEAAGR